MREFTIRDREKLIELLKSRTIMSDDEADTFSHALLDIRESAVEIYDQHLPRLMAQLESNTPDVQDTIWDIREAFRHIDYHLKDAKLPPGS